MGYQGVGSVVSSGDEPAKRRLSIADKTRLKSAVKAIEIMQDPHGRQAVLGELREQLGERFDPGRFASAGLDSWEIFSACERLGGTREFIDVIGFVGEKTVAWENLAALIARLFPTSVLNAADRRILEALLRRIPTETIEQAAVSPAVRSPVVLGPEQASLGIEYLRRLDVFVGEGRLPPEVLWAYLESVAHLVLHSLGGELHRAINAAAEMAGHYAMVRSICAGISGDPAVANSLLRAMVDPPAQVEIEGALSNPGDDMNSSSNVLLSHVPAVMRGLPRRNPYFCGRLETLDELRRALNDRERAIILPHTLHGLGGVGKSQLAIEFAYRFSANYDLVFLLDARDEQSLRRSFASLSKALEIPEGSDIEYTIELTLDALRLGQAYSRWLLIFDDATDPETVQRYLPSESAGHVLVTSRNSSWKAISTFVEVSVFAPAESIEFLSRRWPQLSAEQSVELAERLGFLPLALELAASFHEQTAMQFERFLTHYDRLAVDILYERTPTYPNAVAKTWRMNFDQVELDFPGAAQLLQLCAFFGSAQISVPMLLDGRSAQLPTPLRDVLQDELKLRRAIGHLGRYALVQVDQVRDLIGVHMLVQAVLRDALDDAQRAEFESAVHTLMAAANPGLPDRSETWLRHARLAPHVVASGVIGSDSAEVRQIAVDQIRYLFSIGDYAQSQVLAELAVQDWHTRLGPDDEMTLRTKFHLGNALRVQGDYQQARQLSVDAHDGLSRHLGMDHEYTLQVANSLGVDLLYLGKFELARVQDKENLERQTRVLGPDDPVTLRAANNLALDYRYLGKYEEARKLDEVILRVRSEADSGSINHETLISVNNLVRDLFGVGEYHQALRMQRERLPTFETRIRQPHHRALLGARRNLAILSRKTGELQEALQLAESVLEVLRRKVGPHNEVTLAAMNTVFNTRRVMNDLNGARLLGEQALDAYRSRFHDHPFTFACAVNLAIVYRALGLLQEACDLNRSAVANLRETLGSEHPYTMCALANESNNLAMAGDTQGALALSDEVYQRSLRVRAAGHPNTLLCAVNLALDLEANGRPGEADALRSETLNSLRAKLGREHPETANAERRRRAEADIEVPTA